MCGAMPPAGDQLENMVQFSDSPLFEDVLVHVLSGKVECNIQLVWRGQRVCKSAMAVD